MSTLKMLFIVFWGISTLFWLYYVIRDIIEMVKNGDYMGYCIKMNIALCFMLIFNVIIQILK